ncbi:hypothetical protein GCM10022221_03400 [Actinocorallia aurea]
MSLYTPVLATYRLEQTPEHLIARTLTAWSIGQQTSIAVLTALGELLAAPADLRLGDALQIAYVLTRAPAMRSRRGPGMTKARPLGRDAPQVRL